MNKTEDEYGSVLRAENVLCDQVLFFGRTLEEYVNMFNLDLKFLRGRKVLDCPGGPSSFTAELTARQIDVTACDPMYGKNISHLLRVGPEQIGDALSKQELLPEAFDRDKDFMFYRECKYEAFSQFLSDYALGQIEGRYVEAELPKLPFPDRTFDLVVSGNFLFLYSDFREGGMLFNSPFNLAFHFRAILELCRVSRGEVRIYPVKGPHSDSIFFLDQIINHLNDNNYSAELVPVAYRDVVGAHEMLRIIVDY